MKYQHGALSVELVNISVYIEEKIGQYEKKNENESLLVKRNVYEILKSS